MSSMGSGKAEVEHSQLQLESMSIVNMSGWEPLNLASPAPGPFMF
jgi:hypothetical protein